MPSLQHRIRQRTAAAHAALENTPLMRAFDADSLSMPAYRSYLSLQWRLHAPLETLLARWLPAQWGELRLRKAEWLLQDLLAMDARPDLALPAPCTLDSWAHALGMLYVLEGSTLGLQVVRKQLQHRHRALEVASRFMLGYGAETGRHWRDFLVLLEALPEAEWPLAEATACTTFDHFLRAFSSVDAD